MQLSNRGVKITQPFGGGYDDKRRPLPFLALEGDRAVMCLHDPLGASREEYHYVRGARLLSDTALIESKHNAVFLSVATSFSFLFSISCDSGVPFTT